jgi:hypothetical protein
MLKIIFLVFLCNVVFAEKFSIDERRKKILEIIDEELTEVNRLAGQQDFRVPETILRVSELQLEKGRIWREIENERYLSIAAEQRRSLSKNKYFEKSSDLFVRANVAAERIVDNFPKYKSIGEVYYILAYNNKELAKNEEAKKYFSLAAQKSPKNSKIRSKALLARADYFFNDKKFKEAIPLYEESLNKVDERWWTKDAFNLSWSYYRVKKFDQAINLLKDIHKRSANPKYIDMRSLVERDIGVFYVDAKQVNEAIKFYEGLGLNFSQQFIKIAETIISQGRFSQAESLLDEVSKKEKRRDQRIELSIAQLNLFDKYDKIDAHLRVAKELTQYHLEKSLPSEQLSRLIYYVDKKAAELQKTVTSETYKNVEKSRDLKAKQSIAYFELSGKLSPGKRAEKVFYQAETLYSSGKYKQSINYYVEAFDLAKAAGDTKLQSKCLEGMLSSLAQENDRNQLDQFYVPVYSRFLTLDTKSDRAHSIYVKLFNSYFSTSNISGAEKTLSDFAQSFPGDFKTQEAMLAKIMEYYRNKKDYAMVKSYVSKINEGQFKVSSKYADALRNLMTKIQIEGVQQSLDKGDKAAALKGYHLIYQNPESTLKAKVNSAYNLAALYHEIGDSDQSYKWASLAIQDMDVSDVSNFSDSFLGIAAGLFLRQKFENSAKLSEKVLSKLCRLNSNNKSVGFKNAAFISLSNKDLTKTLEIRDLAKRCDVPDSVLRDVSLELLKDLASEKRWEKYEEILLELEVNSKNFPYLIVPYDELRKQYVNLGDSETAKKINDKQNKFYHVSKTQKMDIPVETLDLIASKMMVAIKNKKKFIKEIPLKFPEEEFNSAIKRKLQELDSLTTEVSGLQKLGSGRGVVEAYSHVIEAYESFGKDLSLFTPEGKGEDYVKSFKTAMADIYGPLLSNAKRLRKEITKIIKDNKILSHSNHQLLSIEGPYPKRFFTTDSGILMERGGRK